MSRKKQKIQHVTAEKRADKPKCDLISTLPWELIAEILSMTSSKEVLALARCSRHFCHSLVTNSRSKHIWENARKSCNPPLPDPTPNFTEPSYAAFVFDGGPCAECGKFTDNFYTSFTLRIRFCNNHKCRTAWMNGNALFPGTNQETEAVTHWLLGSELPQQPGTVVLGFSYYDRTSYYRKSEFNEALKDYRGFVSLLGGSPQDHRRLYHLLHENDAKRKQATISLSTHLMEWLSARACIAHNVPIKNKYTLTSIATQEGWKVADILNAPTCKAMLVRYNRALDCFTVQDFNLIRSDVENEITKMVEKKSRSEEEQAYAKRRASVALDYYRKKSANSTGTNPAVLPTLNVFREQAVIKAMQNKQGSQPEHIIKKLSDGSVKQMIDDNLSAWRDQATKGFMKVLGVKSYNAISTKKLHPVDRLTARFLCSKCLKHASKKRKILPLDFRSACSHQCPHQTKKQKDKAKWSPEQFELDNKAIKVTRKLLALLDVSDDDDESLTVITQTLDRISCKTCDGRIVMNFQALQRHSHRHEDMEIELLSPTQFRELKFQPIQWGLCAKLTSRARSAPRKAELMKYGCQHCQQSEAPVQSENTAKPPETDCHQKSSSKASGRSGKRKKLLSFNGMRCHLLQTHGILLVDDEDIFCADEDIMTDMIVFLP